MHNYFCPNFQSANVTGGSRAGKYGTTFSEFDFLGKGGEADLRLSSAAGQGFSALWRECTGPSGCPRPPLGGCATPQPRGAGRRDPALARAARRLRGDRVAAGRALSGNPGTGNAASGRARSRRARVAEPRRPRSLVEPTTAPPPGSQVGGAARGTASWAVREGSD